MISRFMTDANSSSIRNYQFYVKMSFDLCLNAIAPPLAGTVYPTVWDYGSYDERLRCAFDGIVGIPNPLWWLGLPATGNFKEFAQTRIKEAFTEHSTHLLFSNLDTGPQNKEIWTTESNVHDGLKDANNEINQPYASTVMNTFAHATVLQEWFLRNIKLNLDHDFRAGFFTYATWQNFLGSTTLDFLSAADRQDEVELGIGACPPGTFYDNYYVPRLTYYEMSLLSTINKNHLNYMKSSFAMYLGNVNQPPTVFIAPLLEKKIYVYFTNIKSTSQTYVILPGSIGALYPGYIVTLDPLATIYCIDPDQLYSTSGKNSLYKINTGYSACATVGTYVDRFEVRGIKTIANDPTCPAGLPIIPGGICVTVPPTSSGYIEIPITTTLRLGRTGNMFHIYPNPASTKFNVQYVDPQDNDHTRLQVEIYSVTGVLAQASTIAVEQFIDISKLPVGVYSVLIKKNGYPTETEQLVKMQ